MHCARMTLHNFLSMRKDRIYAPSGFMDVDDGLGNTRGVGETIQVGGGYVGVNLL